MNGDSEISTDQIAYLLRAENDPWPEVREDSETAGASARALLRVHGIGCDTKNTIPSSTAREGADGPLAPESEDVITGLYGYKIPLALLLQGSGDGVGIDIGTWTDDADERVAARRLQGRLAITQRLMDTLYPTIEFAPDDVPRSAWKYGAAVLGVPVLRARAGQPGLPLDRVIRAMRGMHWSALVLAEPVVEAYARSVTNQLIDELRAVRAAAQSERAPSPLAETYGRLLKRGLNGLLESHAVGAWRTTVYLLGDEQSFDVLAAVWRAVFAGGGLSFDPVQVWQDRRVPELAARWTAPELPAPDGPGRYRHPFALQTLLSSAQLAAYIHLPQVETAGFAVRAVPKFDVVPPPADLETSVEIGAVLERSRPTTSAYRVSLGDLTRHCLVAGATGSGKTNTLFHLLLQLNEKQVPFLVIEPAKTEYRMLLAHPRLREQPHAVFTLGNESVSPFRLNPFEWEAGASVATHIDLLKSAFNAAFGMWTPLPQILERCIHDVYRDFGWNTVTGRNDRLGEAHPPDLPAASVFPTLGDLAQKVDEVVEQLGYEKRVTSDIKAALSTRINGLRVGGKGLMLDTARSVPISDLLVQPTVIELEEMGDDEEKAFLMGLLLIRIYEHLRGRVVVEGTGLRHALVIEEAHRLLGAPQAAGDPEAPRARSQAVETFVSMLSEVRAYGQGVLVSEQIPTKLARDLSKNTNLKILHRIVAGDDRNLLGTTMRMSELQRDSVASFPVGAAAVFAGGDDDALLVQVPYVKLAAPEGMSSRQSSDAYVAREMERLQASAELARLFVPHELCPMACGSAYRFCGSVRRWLEDPSVQRELWSCLLSACQGPEETLASYGRLANTVRGRLEDWQEDAMPCLLLQGIARYLRALGRRYAWVYADEVLLEEFLAAAMVALVFGGGSEIPSTARDALEAFRDLYREMCGRRFEPFEGCASACPDGVCMYRHQVAEWVSDRRLTNAFWKAAHAAQRDGRWEDWSAVEEVANGLLPGSNRDDRRSVSLCFGLQCITRNPDLLAEARSAATRRFIDDYDTRGSRSQPGGG